MVSLTKTLPIRRFQKSADLDAAVQHADSALLAQLTQQLGDRDAGAANDGTQVILCVVDTLVVPFSIHQFGAVGSNQKQFDQPLLIGMEGDIFDLVPHDKHFFGVIQQDGVTE